MYETALENAMVYALSFQRVILLLSAHIHATSGRLITVVLPAGYRYAILAFKTGSRQSGHVPQGPLIAMPHRGDIITGSPKCQPAPEYPSLPEDYAPYWWQRHLGTRQPVLI